METTDLYRLLDREGRLLYVGISYNAYARFKQHQRRTFWGQVDYVQIYRYDSRSVAEAVEARVIREEDPIFNIHPGSWAARSTHLPDGVELWTHEVDYFEFGVEVLLYG